MKLKAAKSVALSSNSDTLKMVLRAHLISTYKQHHSKTETESALLSRDSNTIKPLITLYAYR